MGASETLCSQDAVIAVDVQNDFCPGGALGIEGGGAVVPVLNDWLARAARQGALTIASRDWHPVAHCSFESQGGPWPEHCLRTQREPPFIQIYNCRRIPCALARVPRLIVTPTPLLMAPAFRLS